MHKPQLGCGVETVGGMSEAPETEGRFDQRITPGSGIAREVTRRDRQYYEDEPIRALNRTIARAKRIQGELIGAEDVTRPSRPNQTK